MKNRFIVELEVPEFYELEYDTDYQDYDQRDNSTYTSTKSTKKTFVLLENAKKFMKDNNISPSQVTSFIRITNCMNELSG